MNKLASLIIIILLACGGALWFLANGSLNDYIKQQIQTVGSNLTAQTVTVANVDIRLSEGAGTINKFTITNPSHYSYPHLFSLETITLDINLKSLTDTPIIIDAIIIDSPQAFVEITQNGSSNIQDVLDAINKNIPESSATKESDSTEPNIRVNKLILAGTRLSLDLSKLGNKTHQLILPDIELTDIGGKSGLPASQLGAEITKKALAAIWKQAKKTQKQKLQAKLTETLKEKALDKLGSFLNKKS
ncbi:MAG: hypothetical protein ACI9LM_002254 [Alteromonadaceae bacterium]